MRLISQLVLATAIVSTLSACAPVVVGGAAAGGAMAADRRTSGAYLEDEGIEWKALTRANESLGDKIHLNVTSYNRNVLLTGEAIDEAAKQKAEAIAKAVENVRSVTNELQIGGASSYTSRSNDTLLTSKVKAEMIKEDRFPPNYVKVVTEDAVVYLMGMVTQKEAEDAVNIARNTDGVKKVVKVFEYVTE